MHKSLGWIIPLACIMIGALLVTSIFFVFHVSAIIPPSSHQQIVNSITIVGITSTGNTVSLTAKCVDASPYPMCKNGLSILSLSTATFTTGNSYQASAWLWQCYDASILAMQITGPDDTGGTYQINIGRTGAGGTEFTLSINGVPKLTIPKGQAADWANGYLTGYFWFSVSLPVPVTLP